MEDRLNELPKGWVWTRLGEILESVKGKKPVNLSNRDDLFTIPYINIEAFEKKVFTQYTNESSLPTCENNDVLIVWDGARCGLVGRGVSGIIGSTLAKLTCSEMDSSYLFYFLKTKFNEINKRPKGVGIPHVDPNIFWNIDIPLPPLPEQHRIVAKIEELFTKLDAGVEALKKIKAQLKRYRQAVLKYAFEGKLTQEWREANKGKIEPASVLLEKIKEQRKKEAKGKLKELPPMDTSELPELPDGWVWTRLPGLGELNRGKSKHRPRDDTRLFGGNYPFIQTGDVRNSRGLIKSYNQTYNDFGLKQSKLWPINTLCITIAANIAETAILGISACFPDSIVGFIADDKLCEVKYIHFFLKTIKNKLESFAPATAQKNINLDTLKKVVVPLAPFREQKKIVEEIESRLSMADEIEKVMEQSLKQSERLRQSILK